jgi:hypothetical protein
MKTQSATGMLKQTDLEQLFPEQPAIAIYPNPVDFGSVPAVRNAYAAGSKFATLYVRNPGEVDLIIAEITDPTPPFSLDKPLLPLKLGPGEKCSFLVGIQAVSEGSFRASLRFVSNDPVTPVVNVDLIAKVVASPSPAFNAAEAKCDAPLARSKKALNTLSVTHCASNFIAGQTQCVTLNWQSFQFERSSQRKYYFILAFLSAVLMAGLYFKFAASVTPIEQSSSAKQNEPLKRETPPRKVYTVEELKLPQEVSPPPAKQAPPKYADVVVDESWADLPDDNIEQEQLDEMPVEAQREIIERRIKIKLARAKRATQGQPVTSSASKR